MTIKQTVSSDIKALLERELAKLQPNPLKHIKIYGCDNSAIKKYKDYQQDSKQNGVYIKRLQLEAEVSAYKYIAQYNNYIFSGVFRYEDLKEKLTEVQYKELFHVVGCKKYAKIILQLIHQKHNEIPEQIPVIEGDRTYVLKNIPVQFQQVIYKSLYQSNRSTKNTYFMIAISVCALAFAISIGLFLTAKISTGAFIGNTSVATTILAIIVVSILSGIGVYRVLEYIKNKLFHHQYKPDCSKAGYVYKKPYRRWYQWLSLPFELINDSLKWLIRKLILDWPFPLIALIANNGNSHYKTDVDTVTGTLGPLIFAGGLKLPTISKIDSSIYLGPTLGRQYNNLCRHKKNGGEQKYDLKTFQIDYHGDIIQGEESHTIKPYIEKNNLDDLYLIYFQGNSGCYQGRDVEFITQNAKELSKAIGHHSVYTVMWNYPGVLDSTGKVKKAQDLIDAGIAQVERLHHHYGIPYEQIGLYGISLGGSIVAHVAGFYARRGVILGGGIYLDRTFNTTTSVATSYVAMVPFIGKFMSIIFHPFIAFGLWASRWQLDTGYQITYLKHGMYQYTVVRTPKNIREENKFTDLNGKEHDSMDDQVLRYTASLHNCWQLKRMRLVNELFYKLRIRDASEYQLLKTFFNEAKMMVSKIEEQADQKYKLVHCPNICGHVEAEPVVPALLDQALNRLHDTGTYVLCHADENITLNRCADSIAIQQHLKQSEAGVRAREFFAEKYWCKKIK